MGYTHYWNFNEKPSQEKFSELVEGVKQIVATAEEAGIAIGEQVYESGYFSFNGVDAGAHETFSIDIRTQEEDFCKTAEKPYDMVVTASLILAKKIFGADIEIRSDGNWSDWESGQLLYESVYDIQPENVLANA
jgi:hypothetical protein